MQIEHVFENVNKGSQSDHKNNGGRAFDFDEIDTLLIGF